VIHNPLGFCFRPVGRPTGVSPVSTKSCRDLRLKSLLPAQMIPFPLCNPLLFLSAPSGHVSPCHLAPLPVKSQSLSYRLAVAQRGSLFPGFLTVAFPVAHSRPILPLLSTCTLSPVRFPPQISQSCDRRLSATSRTPFHSLVPTSFLLCLSKIVSKAFSRPPRFSRPQACCPSRKHSSLTPSLAHSSTFLGIDFFSLKRIVSVLDRVSSLLKDHRPPAP